MRRKCCRAARTEAAGSADPPLRRCAFCRVGIFLEHLLLRAAPDGTALSFLYELFVVKPMALPQDRHQEEAFAAMEQQLDTVSAHLLSSDALALASSSAALRHAMAVFTRCFASLSSAPLAPAAAQRLHLVQQRLAAQRQALARLAAAADRQSASLRSPAAPDDATYAHAVGRRSTLGGSTARIYHAAS